MVSRYLHAEQCPICRQIGKDNSEDNLAVYDDGHKYCFSCGYLMPSPKTISSTKEKLTSSNEAIMNGISSPDTKLLPLPIDISGNLSPTAKRWLLGYGLTTEEQKKFWWSEEKQQLVYPIFDLEGQLLFWQARNFDRAIPQKYHMNGSVKDHLHILGHEGPLILVEDIISAIKISRQHQSMALFGSHVSKDNLIRIRDFGIGKDTPIGFWLDYDKAQESIKYKNQAMELGMQAFTIITRQDPKTYRHQDISRFIDERFTIHENLNLGN